MDGVSAGITILAAAYSIGKELISAYQSLTHARTEIAEQVTYVKGHWNKTRVQLEVLERSWSSFDDEYQEVQAEILQVLVAKLTRAKSRLDSLLKKSSPQNRDQTAVAINRWKYLFLKPHLDETIDSLEKWQQMFDPSWYLITKMPNPVIDAELMSRRSQSGQAPISLSTATDIRQMLRGEAQPARLTLSSTGPRDGQTHPIPFSPVSYISRPGKNGFLVNSIPCLPGTYAGDMDKDIRTLAMKLNCADPTTFSVLRCRGVSKNKAETSGKLKSFDIVFDTPSQELPRTLRSCLAARTTHTLTERVDLARQLARSVTYVHTLDFVHKNIRPENLIGFGETKLGSFYLIGFEQVRSADGITYFRGDEDWHKNLYRHPDRQGLHPEERYRMQHDIYSLGVCLLEIGLWDTFVIYGENGKVREPNASILGLTVQELARKRPSGIKKLLVDLAGRELPKRMGELYTEVVVNCLTCLDEDNIDFGDEHELDDGTGVAVAVRYIDKILLKLNSISV